MPLDKKELSKLSLKDRLKRLKEVEEERKKEVEETEKLIKETEAGIKQQAIEDKIAIPETKVIDIAELFEKGEGIEKIAKEAPQEFENAVKYQLQADYESLQSMYGTSDPELLRKIDLIGERLEKARYHVESEELANKIVATRALAYKLRKYAGKEHEGRHWGA